MASSLLDSKLDYEQQQMKVERQERSHSDQMFSTVLVETDMASAAATVKVPTTSGVQVKKQISIAPPGSVLLDAADDGKGGKSVKIEEEGGSISGMTGKWTLDGSVDYRGRPALKAKTGRWSAGFLLLVNQGLATLAFFGVGVNLVLFLTRVLQQNNADAANDVSKWTGTVYLFSLVGAFLSDAYWGRYKTCMVFQSIFVLGLVTLSACSYLFLIRPKGCGGNGSSGKEGPSSSSVAVVAVVLCEQHSAWQVGMFYFAVYLVALGYGGYQPNIATFGSDQFDGDDPRESHSKIAFFSYFYLALNLGSLFSNTVLSYVEDEGLWSLGFWVSAASAFLALLLFSVGTPWYRHFRPVGNPLTRVCQVIVAASRKYWLIKAKLPTADGLYEEGQHGSSFHYTTTDSCNPSSMDDNNSGRKLLHTNGFRFLDRAAVPVGPEDFMGLNHPNDHSQEERSKKNYSCNSGRAISANTSGAIVAVAVVDPWKLCTVTQVEEVKCVLRLMPIWLCTILYSVVFTQMASLFVEQGDSMRLDIGNGFRIPAASMSAFDILSVALFIFLYRRVIDPLVCRFNKHRGGKGGGGLTELQRMGIGLVIAIAAMMAAGIVEHYRLKHKGDGLHSTSSSLSVLWQIPQYALIGASEVFMYVGQLEFFNSQTPEGLKSFGSALCMTSISLGNYVSSVIVTIVMKVTAKTTTGTTTSKASPGWIPDNLNHGHLDSFYYLLGILTTLDLVVYLFCAKWYTPIRQAILLENNTISTTTNSSSSNSPSSSSTTSSCSSP